MSDENNTINGVDAEKALDPNRLKDTARLMFQALIARGMRIDTEDKLVEVIDKAYELAYVFEDMEYEEVSANVKTSTDIQ